MASLQDLGFELVNLNAVSVEEQVRLFSAADMIVAPHGAGLTNIMFAPAHCRVVELAVETHCTASYLVIASAVGQRYGYVMCEPRGRNLFVRVDAVRSVLDELEDARECATQPTL
jgi:capsular polysaccharide biosynthesis protein